MPYSQTTRGQLRTQILQAMRAGSYWADEEVNLAINEGLLLWGAMSRYWRARGQFNTVAGNPYYDLSLELPTLRTRDITLGTLTKQLQYHLYEPANGVSGAGMTAQFSVDQFTSALVRKRNEFVIDAKMPFTTGVFPLISPPPAGRFTMPQEVVGIGRLMWRDATTGIYTPLRREDAWSMDSANPNWTLEPGTPYAYSAAETRPIELQLYPAPVNSGSIEAMYSVSANLPIVDGTPLQLPNEFTPAVTWGAMYSILSTQNEGFDPLRAKYAMERYGQLISIAAHQDSLNRIQINDIPAPLDTLACLDAADPFWRNRQRAPKIGGCIFDLLMLTEVPNGIYGVSCDVVQSAPLPQGDSDFIQMGYEEISYVIEYCRHILSFKLGGAEFVATMPLMDSFTDGTRRRAGLGNIQSKYYSNLFGQSSLEQSYAPVA